MALQHSSEKIPTLACCNNYFVQWKSIEIFSQRYRPISCFKTFFVTIPPSFLQYQFYAYSSAKQTQPCGGEIRCQDQQYKIQIRTGTDIKLWHRNTVINHIN